jgi:hypothetical protein
MKHLSIRRIALLAAIIMMFGLDLSAHLLNFPIRIILVQMAVWISEPLWMRQRISD